ncbi:DUF1674 domain-containing protein [Maricaulis sp.]|uniref:DUF1674 domain-containing protein n=1 Tax=Maricaulis sp. TaxID=1486257 RepID=UPI002632E9C5|nr:DUF1674 domain-containing protein [Maricaulis sp.]
MTETPDQGGNTPGEIPAATVENAAPGKALSPAAKRALEEAAARRAAQAETEVMPDEQGGPKGPEPTRFGDWERKGIVSDF